MRYCLDAPACHRSVRRHRLVPAQPCAFARDLRSHRSCGVLLAADRAPQSDRVLRRAPAGLQHHLADAARPRRAARRSAAGEVVRARHRSRQRRARRAAQRRGHDVAVARRGARLRAPRRRGHRSTRSSGAVRLRGPSGHARAKRSTPRSSTRRCTRRRCSTCGIACRTTRSGSRRVSATNCGLPPAAKRRAVADRSRSRAGARDARRRSRSPPVRMGQRVRRASGRGARVRHRRAQRDQRGVPGVRRGRRLPRPRRCGLPRTGSGCSRTGVEHPGVLDRSATAAMVAGAGCSRRFRCRRPGRCTSARRRRRPTRAGRAAVFRRRPNSIAPRSATACRAVERRISVGRRAAGRSRAATSISTRWEPVPGRLPSGGRERVGRARPRRQRLGMDVDGLWSVPGLFADGVVSGVLGGLLRRSALRHEGGLARDRQRAPAPQLPQLVQAELSIRVRDVQDRGISAGLPSYSRDPSR